MLDVHHQLWAPALSVPGRSQPMAPGGAADLASADAVNDATCPDSLSHPVCGSQTVAGKPELLVTFENAGEFGCLTQGDLSWTAQCAGGCVCNCTDAVQPVCGSDGITYTPGACP